LWDVPAPKGPGPLFYAQDLDRWFTGYGVEEGCVAGSKFGGGYPLSDQYKREPRASRAGPIFRRGPGPKGRFVQHVADDEVGRRVEVADPLESFSTSRERETPAACG